MKEKLMNAKDYVMGHKKEVILGLGLGVLAIVSGAYLTKYFKKVEIASNEDEVEEISCGTIEVIGE